MGTSTSQRSPATPEWESVRDLYREGVSDPGAVSRRIVHALGPDVRSGMAGPGVSACLDTLLGVTRLATETPPTGPFAGVETIITAAARIRVDAERRIAIGGLASRFSDLALDALGSTALHLAVHEPSALALDGSPTQFLQAFAAFHDERRLHDLASRFFSEDIGSCFRYFVARDIPEFVGTSSLPTALEARSISDQVAQHCRALSGRVPLEDYESRLGRAISDDDPQRRRAVMADLLTHALQRGLDAIGGASDSAHRPRPRHPRAPSQPQEQNGDEQTPAHQPPSLCLIAAEDREPDVQYLPVYSLQAAAGHFGLGEHVAEAGYVQVPDGLKFSANLFVAQIVGQSMEPRIPDGSFGVFRSPVVGSRNGKTVLAQKRGYSDPDTGGAYTVKRYESSKQTSEEGWRHTAIRLIPENPNYDVIHIAPEDADDLAIVAELVMVLE